MDHIITSTKTQSLLKTNKVLRNTYCLLGMTLSFSATIAIISAIFSLPSPNIFLTIIGCYGLMFLTYKLSNKSSGILSVFAFTGFLGYCLGPILNQFFNANMGNIVAMSFGGTALVFFCCSAWILNTKKNMSFLQGMVLTGCIVLLLATIVNIFLQISTLCLVISAMFILLSSASILLETSNIIHGGETNYIRATISLYVSLYNIFISLLNILGFTKKEE